MKTIYAASYDAQDKGIDILKFDESTQSLKLLNKKKTEDIPTYLINHQEKLFVCYKNQNACGNRGGIQVFNLDDHLTSIAHQGVQGKSYTHLAVTKDEKFIAAADYHTGSVDLYAFDGAEIGLLDIVFHEGKGPNPDRQQQSHIHFVGFTPDEKLLYSIDLGNDLLRFYEYQDGELKHLPAKDVSCSPGAGPRHGVFSHDSNYFYLVNELDNTLQTYQVSEGGFELIHTTTTLPGGVLPESLAGAIRLSQSGQSLFISNRGFDSIAYFKLDPQTGAAMLKDVIPCKGHPRDLNIFDNRHLFVASLADSEIQLFLVDEAQETVTDSGISLPLLKPVCLEFGK